MINYISNKGSVFNFNKCITREEIISEINLKLSCNCSLVENHEYDMIAPILENHPQLIDYYSKIYKGNFIFINNDTEVIIIIKKIKFWCLISYNCYFLLAKN